MIKNLKKYSVALVIAMACCAPALADGNAFTPLNFDDASYSQPNFSNLSTASGSAQNAPSKNPTGNSKMQSAILELDNAQIDVRNDLLNYKAKYADVDAQYQVIKAERKALDKQIRDIERRIKKIEKDKANIRKNMI